MHLSFIVDQTEKYSTWLTEGLATKSASSTSSSPSRTDAGTVNQLLDFNFQSRFGFFECHTSNYIVCQLLEMLLNCL